MVAHLLISIENVAILNDVVVLLAADGPADIDEERVGFAVFFKPSLGAGEAAQLSCEAATGFEASVGVAGEVDLKLGSLFVGSLFGGNQKDKSHDHEGKESQGGGNDGLLHDGRELRQS